MAGEPGCLLGRVAWRVLAKQRWRARELQARTAQDRQGLAGAGGPRLAEAALLKTIDAAGAAGAADLAFLKTTDPENYRCS